MPYLKPERREMSAEEFANREMEKERISAEASVYQRRFFHGLGLHAAKIIYRVKQARDRRETYATARPKGADQNVR